MEENTPNTGSKLKGTLSGQRTGSDSAKEPVSWNTESVSWNPEPAVKTPEPAAADPKPAYNFDPKTGRPANSEVRNPAVSLYGPPPTNRTSQPAYSFDPKTGRPVNPVNPVNPVYPVYPEEPAKKKKTGLIIGLIAGGVALIAALVLILVFVGRKKELSPAEFTARCRSIGFQYVQDYYDEELREINAEACVDAYMENFNGKAYEIEASYFSFANAELAKAVFTEGRSDFRGRSGEYTENTGKNWEKIMLFSDSEAARAVMRIGKTIISVYVDNDSDSAVGFREFCEQLLNDLTK
nr:hypothetical protein [Lachnospiraceae bacterium]